VANPAEAVATYAPIFIRPEPDSRIPLYDVYQACRLTYAEDSGSDDFMPISVFRRALLDAGYVVKRNRGKPPTIRGVAYNDPEFAAEAEERAREYFAAKHAANNKRSN
jgi:hypothetical protein